MEPAKYIIVDHGGLEVPIIFNPIITHADMAANFGGKHNVIGAGFCGFEANSKRLRVWGRSDSLGIDSCPEDAKNLNQLFQTE